MKGYNKENNSFQVTFKLKLNRKRLNAIDSIEYLGIKRNKNLSGNIVWLTY